FLPSGFHARRVTAKAAGHTDLARPACPNSRPCAKPARARSTRSGSFIQQGGRLMKIVGFEANGGLRLGVVEGDNVVDLQAVDANVPGDLGEVLRRGNGDLSA